MKPIPVDTGSFVEIRTSTPQKLYVDKTAYLHRLITDPQVRRFFISRPRRFGKSLMISTLKAIFQGKRELFKGLAIDSLDYDWKTSPVLHFNFAFCAAASYMDFIRAFPLEVARAIREAGASYDASLPPSVNLGAAVDQFAADGTPCIILIDEYDDPVAKALKHVDEAETIRETLATLYSQLKDRTEKIRFMMVTGVSKFTKMSIFSAISNIMDLSFSDEYASMLGYTDSELDQFFSEHITAHATVMNLDIDAYRAELRRLYNGYRFWKNNGENVYNPVSINLTMAFREKHFQSYWTDTGRPSMLMNFLKREAVIALDPECVRNVGIRDFDVMDLSNIHAVSLLYQTGYLTIRDYDPSLDAFTLGIPDEEVRRDLSLLMTSQLANKDVAWAQSLGFKLLTNAWDDFFTGLASLYASAPYGSREGRVHESSYTRNLVFLLKSQGIACHPEETQANGRVDLVAEHPCGIFIFELKIDRPAQVAMSQAEQKAYAAPYRADRRPVWIIGLSFDAATRTLKDHCVLKFNESATSPPSSSA